MSNATSGFDAEAVRYNKEETVDYQRRQLPAELSLSSSDWEEIFSPFRGSRPTVKRPHSGTVDAIWKIDTPARLNGAYVGYDEFGYDEDGHVCRLTPERSRDGGPGRVSEDVNRCKEIMEHIVSYFWVCFSPCHADWVQSYPGTEPSLSTCRWSGQRFGREWKFGLNGVRDDSLFSIAALQLCRDADVEENGPLGVSRQGLAKYFLAQFRGTWDLSRNLWGSSDHRWANSIRFNKSKWEDVVFQYHMRAFTAPSWWLRPPGRGVRRVSGPLPSNQHKPSSEHDTDQRISELRYSVGLKTTWRLDLPVFTLVTMTDSDTAGRLEALGQLGSKDEWLNANIHPSIRATGTAAFAFRIHSLLPEWNTQWSNLIDEIGKALNNDILRTAAEWIRESMDDLHRTVDDMERLYLARTIDGGATFLPEASDNEVRDAAVATFKQNWESVLSKQNDLGAALLTRIATKQEETKSLRDGLFSATSVSEVKNSTQLNRYILIFTTVTIFYLPLSFITDSSQVKWFAVTIVIVAGITYLFSGISMWVAARSPALAPNAGSDNGTGLNATSPLDMIQPFIPGRWRKSGNEDVELTG
ncbi:hypothetical protein B0T14DRAFT_426627 [Immersiella caudata]|uniref:Uncharacterized protein n=1 Tax=Immersiella caudata TaxID=314043 RepID=A0AA39WYF2_9PEZI|nr:hypothetical protein B0T14DRAFT_426627 [Immersiella caudata]